MLLDSNLLISSLLPTFIVLRQWILANAPVVSAVTYVETLGYHQLAPNDKMQLERFFAATTVLPITKDILDTAISLRQQRRMSLGDSLIAATCLVHNLILATQNTRDFQWVPGLTLADPLAAPLNPKT